MIRPGVKPRGKMMTRRRRTTRSPLIPTQWRVSSKKPRNPMWKVAEMKATIIKLTGKVETLKTTYPTDA